MKSRHSPTPWLAAAGALAAALLAVAALSGLSDFDLSGRAVRPVALDTRSGRISGTLFLPATEPDAFVLIVHGDGPQDRTSSGGYLPLINTLLDENIAVLGWDKPGVGESAGDWLAQSMADRADEAAAVLDALLAIRPDARGKAGFLGFSQAGWVLPEIASRPETPAAFIVCIGAALDWQRQGDYYTRRRLEARGWPRERIDRHLKEQSLIEDKVFEDLAAGRIVSAKAAGRLGVSPERLAFIARNRNADATGELARVRLPWLAVWGADDLNVDAVWNAEQYARLLKAGPAEARIVVMPAATHGLLRAPFFNYQLVRDWPWHARAAFLALGRHAYAPDALARITDWIRVTAAASSGA